MGNKYSLESAVLQVHMCSALVQPLHMHARASTLIGKTAAVSSASRSTGKNTNARAAAIDPKPAIDGVCRQDGGAMEAAR